MVLWERILAFEWADTSLPDTMLTPTRTSLHSLCIRDRFHGPTLVTRPAGADEVNIMGVNPPPAGDATIAVLCGLMPLQRYVSEDLERLGYRIEPTATTRLVVDAPRGFALNTLEAPEGMGVAVVVAHWDSCPEYIADLMDLEPYSLLAGSEDLGRDSGEAISRLHRGERYHLVPSDSTPLLAIERRVLRRVAQGWTNRRIAEHLHVQEQSVMNSLTHVYEKLRLHSRTQAALYYWGLPYD